jgi:hypothetical protein
MSFYDPLKFSEMISNFLNDYENLGELPEDED